jgi:MFS family permease
VPGAREGAAHRHGRPFLRLTATPRRTCTLVYPALIASISDHAHPAWRANASGTYRFWRDIGYAAGALVAGVLADWLGLNATVIAAAVLTAASGLLAARWITEHRPGAR